MKILYIGLLTFSVMVAFSCNNRQGKKAENDTAAIIKPMAKTPITEEPDYAELYERKVCESIAKEILTTSPRYKKLTKGLGKAVIKNGGMSFGIRLEGSPNHVQDKFWKYSKTYDFTIYEIYADREVNTARFSFNPDENQLYEYDEVDNQPKPIEFDRSLLKKFDVVCK